ncbi:MAG TPA: ABC transporter substrate binding protein [Dissulfurispiraceae bacterium]|nr:ABC transporter substrate binding protein [Dissulfurispiraceae bacterium]
MLRRNSLAILCSCLVMLLSLSFTVSFAAGPVDSKKRVLILHSYHKGLKWTDSEDEGINAVLKTRGSQLEVHTEYMDTKHHSDNRHFSMFADFFRQKYSSMALDVIIVSDDDAYNFMLKQHEALFRDVPVVFCGVNFFDASIIEKKRDTYTGVVEAYDIRSTLRTALALHPDTYRIVIINDRSVTGIANKKILNEVMPEFERKVSVVYFEDLDMEDLLKRVSLLNRGDIILLMTFNKDRSGRVFVYDDSISLVAKASRVPMYGVWDFFLGKGIVGGMLTSGANQGKLAAEMALRILDGEKVRSIPVVKESPNRYMFDYEQLSRFSIRQGNLPEGSVVINRPVSFYEEHRGKVLAVAAIILALSGMLIALLVNIERRKKTESSLRKSEEKFEKIFRFSPDWIAILRLSDGTYVDVNDAFIKTTGYAREEVIGRTSLDIGIYVNPEQRYEIDSQFLQKGRVEKNELQYRMKSGEIKTVERSGEILDIAGERCIVSIVRDVTAKKEAEMATLESERQKKLRKEAEIKMLQAQINPHFLFNAITTIIHYTRTAPDVATELLMKLADFFRKNIKPERERVPLSKELEHCDDYIGIERARFEERLHVTYDIDPAALECRVPPLILQPLVENALRHGILPKEQGGKVVIGAHREGALVRIFVQDDGVGMTQKQVEVLFIEPLDQAGEGGRAGAGMALQNVNARLVAIYGPEHGLAIESTPGQGTKITFTVPEC